MKAKNPGIGYEYSRRASDSTSTCTNTKLRLDGNATHHGDTSLKKNSSHQNFGSTGAKPKIPKPLESPSPDLLTGMLSVEPKF